MATIVTAFQEGTTAEQIVQQYPTLSLAAVYQVIRYYLGQQQKVETYLRQRFEEAAVWRENERRFDSRGVRTHLLSRQKSKC